MKRVGFGEPHLSVVPFGLVRWILAFYVFLMVSSVVTPLRLYNAACMTTIDVSPRLHPVTILWSYPVTILSTPVLLPSSAVNNLLGSIEALGHEIVRKKE